MVEFPYWEILTVNCLQHYSVSNTSASLQDSELKAQLQKWPSLAAGKASTYAIHSQTASEKTRVKLIISGECALQEFKRAPVNAAAGEGSKIIGSALFSMAWAWDPMHVLLTLIKKKKKVRSDEYSC